MTHKNNMDSQTQNQEHQHCKLLLGVLIALVHFMNSSYVFATSPRSPRVQLYFNTTMSMSFNRFNDYLTIGLSAPPDKIDFYSYPLSIGVGGEHFVSDGYSSKNLMRSLLWGVQFDFSSGVEINRLVSFPTRTPSGDTAYAPLPLRTTFKSQGLRASFVYKYPLSFISNELHIGIGADYCFATYQKIDHSFITLGQGNASTFIQNDQYSVSQDGKSLSVNPSQYFVNAFNLKLRAAYLLSRNGQYKFLDAFIDIGLPLYQSNNRISTNNFLISAGINYFVPLTGEKYGPED